VRTHSDMRGVTLVELLVVIVIIGILASIAVPSYRNYLLRAQRSDATAALLRMAAAQEKFYLQNNTYTTDVTPTGLNLVAATPLNSEHGWYQITVAAGASGLTVDYVATATALAAGPQIKDTPCRTFTINQNGLRGAKDSSNTVNTALCWR
jgi:type IV pilus assembly protein PilE